MTEKGLEELRDQITEKIELSKKSQLTKTVLKDFDNQSSVSAANEKASVTKSVVTKR